MPPHQPGYVWRPRWQENPMMPHPHLVPPGAIPAPPLEHPRQPQRITARQQTPAPRSRSRHRSSSARRAEQILKGVEDLLIRTGARIAADGGIDDEYYPADDETVFTSDLESIFSRRSRQSFTPPSSPRGDSVYEPRGRRPARHYSRSHSRSRPRRLPPPNDYPSVHNTTGATVGSGRGLSSSRYWAGGDSHLYHRRRDPPVAEAWDYMLREGERCRRRERARREREAEERARVYVAGQMGRWWPPR